MMSRIFVAALLLATASAFNCTKDGCPFSFTNLPDIQGRRGPCGEVDAAPDIPDDLWADPAAVKAYVSATLEFTQAQVNANCDHNPDLWIQNGSKSVKWMSKTLDETICARYCHCDKDKGVPCTDVPDKPNEHEYCSLCGPKYNQALTVYLWYPYKNPSLKNIVQLAQSVPDLSTLVTALVAGQLTATLSGKGPFTVFAPTNEGFAKLPAATLAHLLDPKNIKELRSILEYHVIAGAAIFSKDLKTFQKVKTVEGAELEIAKVGGRVLVQNTTVTKADNDASNGVVHIIDGVLIPPSTQSVPSPNLKNIVQLAQSVPDLSTLVSALVAGQLTTTLSSKGPFTVFAPTNEGFNKLPPATLVHLLDPANIKELQAVLEYHVLSGAVFSKDLKTFQMVKTVEGAELKIEKTGSRVVVQNATVTKADNAASNGVVHIIDGVLIPPATPTPAPGPVNHLWFRHLDFATLKSQIKTCGEVDAAPHMPPALFDPANAAELKLYEEVTLRGWDADDNFKLAIGRCGPIGYTVPHGEGKAVWNGFMNNPDSMQEICHKYCHCTYSGGHCRNQTHDDPKNGHFCTLCSEKYDAPGIVYIFEKPNATMV